MKKFPGHLVYQGSNHKIVLTDEQVEWLRKVFPSNENARICKAIGICYTTLMIFARQYGLKKSEDGMAAIIRRSRIAAAKTNEKNGCYARKRGHPVSDATKAGIVRRWQEERDGLRENALVRMRREDPERYLESMRKRSAERKESIRKEKMRVMYGLERKTKLKGVVLCPYKPSQINHRRNALLRGYLLDEDCSEGSEGRYTIYYDNQTERNAKFEANCIKDGFKIVEDK